MLKRVGLFLLINFVIVITMSLIMQIFHLGPYVSKYGLDMRTLALFCLLWGMGGAFISLLLSRKMAKWMFSIQIIDPRQNSNLRSIKLYKSVVRLSQRIGLPEIPQVGIFNSPEPNAFATGPSKRSSLVAVSSGLLENLNDDEIEAVLGHELAHIANGDMVTMTLLQGIINAFVMFLARILAFVVSGFGRGRNSRNSSSPMSFYLLTFAFEIIFMIGGSMVVAIFSRHREYRADRGSASINGARPMIAALKKLQSIKTTHRMPHDARMRNVEALMISKPRSSHRKWSNLFATHPPLEKRIEELRKIEAKEGLGAIS